MMTWLRHSPRIVFTSLSAIEFASAPEVAPGLPWCCLRPISSPQRPGRPRSRHFETPQAGRTFEHHVYEGAPHAFFNDSRPTYRPEAADDAWEQVLDFLARTLGT
ncbi:MAG TPA: dienelactone hydrolase family protein [Candidatus Dormibacteraeota bacterium]